MLRSIWLLLLLWGVAVALDELEYDAEVAPPPAEGQRPVLSLWRGFVGQVRQVLRQWRPAGTTTTRSPRIQLRSTTPESEELQDYDAPGETQVYGALNPIYQTLNF